MSLLTFTDDMARLAGILAQCHDMVIRRSTVVAALNLRTGERVLDVGCGRGFYAYEAAQCVGPTGRVCATDISPDQITAARARCAELEWVECQHADAVTLPYEDAAFDVVYGAQVFEYIVSLDMALREVHRVLRPGGRCAILATDWRTVVWHSCHPDRMQRVMTAWAAHTHTRDLPSILGVKLRQAGLEPPRQTPVPILNRSYHGHSFSYWIARMIRAFVVGRQAVAGEEAEAWLQEFDALEQHGAFFFCLTPILTEYDFRCQEW
jgi:ubiquinone/menaquinone biosynthesis C-methylase UbiE